jgi:hypothetical protein
VSRMIPLSEIPRALLARYGRSPSYQRVWKAIVDARLPAERENGRWVADPEATAELFGIDEEIESVVA